MSIEAFDIAIDVSHHQGAIDWPVVAAAGIKIAMIKATEGTNFVDPRWDANWRGAERVGLAVIPYHFLRPIGPGQQAAHFRRVASLAAGMPFCLDWEGAALETATAAECQAIGDELAAVAGRKPLGYWGVPGSAPGQPTAAMLDWPRWVARYPNPGAERWQNISPSRRKDPARCWLTGTGRLPEFAQYTDKGRVPGIAGDVDRNVAFFPSADDAVAWCRGAATAPLQPARIVAAPAKADALQRRLAELGYQIDIDGKAGDLTCGAALDALKGLPAAETR